MISSCINLKNFKPDVSWLKKIKFQTLLPVCFMEIEIKVFAGSELGNFNLRFIVSINFQWHPQKLKVRVLQRNDKDEKFWTLQLYTYPFIYLSYQTRNLISNGNVVSLKILTFFISREFICCPTLIDLDIVIWE